MGDGGECAQRAAATARLMTQLTIQVQDYLRDHCPNFTKAVDVAYQWRNSLKGHVFDAIRELARMGVCETSGEGMELMVRYTPCAQRTVRVLHIDGSVTEHQVTTHIENAGNEVAAWGEQQREADPTVAGMRIDGCPSFSWVGKHPTEEQWNIVRQYGW